MNTARAGIWTALALAVALTALGGCKAGPAGAEGAPPPVTVAVTPVVRKTLQREIAISSELVPYQQIDVYAKESGFVQSLNVDYGSRVQKGDVMAVLEIPELQAQLQQDQARITTANDEIDQMGKEVARYQAMDSAIHKEYDRLNQVMLSQQGLVAQQEVDDAQSKDMAAASQADAAEAQLAGAKGELAQAQAQLARDQALFAYAHITAPFAGVVTQRYANLGTLIQGGTSSSTQAMPLVQLSEDDRFRLVIPVPEAYVPMIHIGDPVQVAVGSLGQSFPGEIVRTSDAINDQTRTMHTEVRVLNPDNVLKPGMYAEARLTLEHHANVLSVPVGALNHAGTATTVTVVNGSGEIEEPVVTVGLQTDTDAEILRGLREGEDVVVGDRGSLKPGERVKPQVVPLVAMPSTPNQS